MDYRRFGDSVVIRIDKGEEIISSLLSVAEREAISLAEVGAIGAINDFTVGVFHPGEKKYAANHFQGDFEIVSLCGTLTVMDGRPYCHLHLSAGDETGRVFGGHCNSAFVSATCEMVLRLIDGTVGRRFSEEIGLNLLHF